MKKGVEETKASHQGVRGDQYGEMARV